MPDLLWVNANDEAERQQASPGDWVVATVEPRFGWPTRPQLVMYEGVGFLLMPQHDATFRNSAIALEVNRHGFSREAARKVIMRFCSSLSWSENAGLTILAWGAGDRPRPIGMPLHRVTTPFLETRDLPYPVDEQTRAALALYREGVSLDNPFYAFLSLYKVISVLWPNGRERGTWVAGALPRLDSEQAIRRREELAADGRDVGVYLRDEGRHAVAHAERQPYANPDNIDDHFRLSQDLPLLRNLAELAVEENTAIRRARTVRREHLHELAGFKTFLPKALIDALSNQEDVETEGIDLPDQLTLIARRGPEVQRLDGLVPTEAAVDGGSLCLRLQSEDSALTIQLRLEFAQERLQFDPLADMVCTPNRAHTEGLRAEIRFHEFRMALLLNGRLEVWEPAAFLLLGQTAEYIPRNLQVDYPAYEQAIGDLKQALANQEAPR